MRKTILVSVLCVVCMGYYTILQSQSVRFQGQLHLRRSVEYPTDIKLRIDFYDDSSMLNILSKNYEVEIGKDGVFTVDIDSLQKLASRNTSIEVFLDTDKSGKWISGGKSKIYTMPYSIVSKNILDGDSTKKRIQEINNDLIFRSFTDTIFYISAIDEKIATGGEIKPWLDWSLGKNQRMYFKTTEDDLYNGSMINLNWTILSSKPAIVCYDKDFTRHYAIVAHYWSNSGRVHQHISMEVDDNEGAVQTRFELPWGEEKITIETHSADFRVENGGCLFVGDNKEDTSNMYVYENLFSNACLQKDKDKNGAYLWSISENGNAIMDIYQESGLSRSSIGLSRDTNLWSLYSMGNFNIRNNNKPKVLINKEGQLIVGTVDHSVESVLVEENMNSNGSILTHKSAIGEYMEKEGILSIGDIVGINPNTAKIRRYRTGDLFCGIVVSTKEAAVRLNKGLNGEKELVANLGLVFVNTSQCVKTNGKLYTIDGDLIGIAKKSDYVILTLGRE